MRSFRKPLIPLNGAKVRRKSHLAKLFRCFLPRLPAFLGPHVVAWYFRASEPPCWVSISTDAGGWKTGHLPRGNLPITLMVACLLPRS